MDSARIIINNQDLSTATELQQQTPVTGFTVVKAPKGPATPVRISKGDTAKIQDIFGVASSEFPELYEAQLFNTGYDLYLSAPYSEAKIPVAYITSKGIFAAASPVEYNTSIEQYINGDDDASLLSSIYSKPSAEGDIEILIPVTHAYTVTKATTLYGRAVVEATAEDIKITLPDGISKSNVLAGISGENDNVLEKLRLTNLPKGLSIDDIAISSENCDDASGKVVVTVSHANELTVEDCNKIEVYFVYKFQDNLAVADELFNIHGAIFPKYPSSRKMHISFGAFSSVGNYRGTTLADKNLLKISAYEEGAFHDKAHPVTFSGSLDSTARDGNGAFIGFSGINAPYMEQNLLAIHVIKPFDEYSCPVSGLPYAPVVLEGGYKHFGDEVVPTTEANTDVEGILTVTEELVEGSAAHTSYSKGWTYAKEEEYSVVDIFFDSRRASRRAAVDTFFTVGDSHELAGFIFNKTLKPEELSTEDTALSHGNRYWNICNEAVVEFASTGARFISPLTGSRALMQAKIIEQRWGGVAPMYLNVTGLGGQLSALNGSKFVKLKYKYNKAEQMKLDELNYNPVIRDNTYGVMVVGQKTCVSGATSDWSYIGHVSAFLNFEREVKNTVMVPQLGKANNDYYRSLRKQQVENILAKRISGNNRIWAGAIVDTSTADGVNDAQTRRERKFVINVMVKVDVFSEYVILNFTNVDQDFAL